MVVSSVKKLLVCVLAVSLALCLSAFPAVAAGKGGGEPKESSVKTPEPSSADCDLYNQVRARSYLNLKSVDLEKDKALKNRVDEMIKDTPEKLLPASVLELKRAQAVKGKGNAGDADIPGDGGSANWTPFNRSNTVDATLNYSASPYNNVIDRDGTQHTIIEISQSREILPGPPPTTRYLSRLYHATYSEGAWSKLTELTPTNRDAFEDVSLVGMVADPDGNIHVLYTKGSYATITTPWGSTEVKKSNTSLIYRYRSPDGKWSSQKTLAAFSGYTDVSSAQFLLEHNTLYIAWLQQTFVEYYQVPDPYGGLDTKETHNERVCFVDGAKTGWNKYKVLKEYQYPTDYWGSFDDADQGYAAPNSWSLRLDVSPTNGEVAIAYSVFEKGATAVEGKGYIYAGTRYGTNSKSKGKWSGFSRISSVAANQDWDTSTMVYDQVTGIPRLVASRVQIVSPPWGGTSDPNLPPARNLFLFEHGTKWKQVQISNCGAGRMATTWPGILVDPVTREWRVYYDYRCYVWSTTGSYWDDEASGLSYAQESKGRFSNTVINGLSTGWYVGGYQGILDRNGSAHLLFELDNWSPDPVQADQAIKYITNAPSGKGGGFQKAVRLDKAAKNSREIVALTCNSQQGLTATWLETHYETDPVLLDSYQTLGRLVTRYKDVGAKSWGNQVTLNSDMVTVPPNWWGGYGYDSEESPSGDRFLLFQTGKVQKTADGTDYEYVGWKRYFAESRNGAWTTEMISNSGNATDSPNLILDRNNRAHAIFESQDSDKLYETMQAGAAPPTSTYYFAEGTTRTGFQEWLCLQNPGGKDAKVTITYMLGTGVNKKQPVTVPKHSRKTIDVNTAVGANQDVSAMVTSTQPLVAERPMYFSFEGGAQLNWTGGSDVIGSTDLSRVWYFAEGTTRKGFEEFLTLQNPAGVDTKVDITYILGNGSTKKQQVTVGKKSRKTVDVKGAVGENQDVSVKIESQNAGIVAERPMYFKYDDKWTGGHDVMGARSLRNRWYFAEGTTRPNFDTYLCVQNPYSFDVDANVTYIMGGGKTKTQKLTLGKTSRKTVTVNDVVGANQDVSIMLDAAAPVVAERPMYFNYDNKWDGGSVTMGAVGPKNSWFFAEGTTRNDFNEYLSLQNPGTAAASVKMRFMLGNGQIIEKRTTVGKQSRATVDVRGLVGSGLDVSVSIWSNKGIIAERPMYFVYNGVNQLNWTGGHDVMGL